MKKLVLLLTTVLLFAACGDKKDKEADASLAKKSAELAQAEAELAKLKADLAKAQVKEKEEDAQKAALKAEKKLAEAQKAELEVEKAKLTEAQKAQKTESSVTTTPVALDGSYTFLHEGEIASLSVGELWATYKAARAEAKTLKADGNLQKSIEKLLLAAECTVKLNRPDVAAWQFNNAGKQAIDLFVEKTGYAGYKKVHQSLYNQNRAILEKGLTYLKKAQEMDDKESDAKRADLIRRNLLYIENLLKEIG